MTHVRSGIVLKEVKQETKLPVVGRPLVVAAPAREPATLAGAGRARPEVQGD